MDTSAPTLAKVPVTVTLSPGLVTRLDAVAERQDRSRSWLTGEAIRRYLEAEAAQPGGAPTEHCNRRAAEAARDAHLAEHHRLGGEPVAQYFIEAETR